MSFNVDALLSVKIPDKEAGWDDDKVILYHLGLGAGAKFLDPSELQYTYEAQLKVLPAFAVIPVFGTTSHVLRAPGVTLNPAMNVHGEHEIIIHEPLQRRGEVVTKSRVTDVFDRRSGTMYVVENKTVSKDDGRLLFTNIWSLFNRGSGGWGGESGPKNEIEIPTRAPDSSVELPILPQQNQIYRLSGDKTLFHVDPEIAKKSGFETPIMHGLCSYGMICKAAVDTMLDGDVTKVARFRGRFAKPIHPGETIIVSAWREGGRIILETKNKERDTPVMTNCFVEVRG